MKQPRFTRFFSVMLSLLMVFSLCPLSVFAADRTVTIQETTVTPETTALTVTFSDLPASGIFRIVAVDAGEDYESSKLNTYQSLSFAVVSSLSEGTNKMALSSAPTAGTKLYAVLRDSTGSVSDTVSAPVTVTSKAASTPKEILANCSVELLKDGTFKESDTGVRVRVKLDESVARCNMTVFSYASNTTFDPDSIAMTRLWSGYVTDGFEEDLTFNSPLQKGFSIIACLNVPVGEDYYLPCNSQSIRIVDENGEGFEDYVYPDVTIDETQLIEGATTLHISITGDQRLFAAAQAGQTSIICAVAQYPEGETFDFESERQISLASNINAGTPFTHKEITLSEPLKAGYRVRAVVYWGQNTQLFLAKGNDYEAMFHRPDDSVAVTPLSQTGDPAVSLTDSVTEGDETVHAAVTGVIPDGTILLLKSFSDSETISSTAGTPLGVTTGIQAKEYDLTPTSSLTAGRRIVAFLLNNGSLLAQSEPVTVKRAVPFSASLSGLLTSESTTADFTITALLPSLTNINIVRLYKTDASGNPDTSAMLAQAFAQKPGSISLSLTEGSLSAGDSVCLVLTYVDGGETLTWQSQTFPVSAPAQEESVSIVETSFTVDSQKATVSVAGCDNFKGGYLFLTTGKASETDQDSRTRLASAAFNGEGIYELPFSKSVALKEGNTIQAYLYRYDSDAEFIYTKVSEPVLIAAPAASDSISFKEGSYNNASTSATLTVTGYDAFKGGLLILTTGKASETDGDNRTRLGSAAYTGSGDYSFNWSTGLKAGDTLLAYLYRYDADEDRTYYQYGDPVTIASVGGIGTEAAVAIVTSQVLADRSDLWVRAVFDESLTGILKLYCHDGDSYTGSDLIYSGAIASDKDSQKVTFGANRLTAGKKLTAVLELSDQTQKVSSPVTVQAVPEKQKPTVSILDRQITAGDTKMTASIQFDNSLDEATYTLYQFSGDTLDPATAEVLYTRALWRSSPSETLPIRGKIKVGSHLQIVLTAGDDTAYSQIVTIEPSPDWGNPYAAFDVTAVKADAESVSVTVDYSDEYLSLGSEFYCDVTVYQFPAGYTDQDVEEKELWENTSLVKRVAQVNSRTGHQTKGALTLPFFSSAELTPGSRLIIKLRLPHTEWEGEEVDYLSVSVPVIGPDEEVPAYKAVLYNLGEDTSRGERLRTILTKLGIPAETVTYADLNETVGYLSGTEGYTASKEAYTGKTYDNEFLLLCNLPESLLDRILDEMTAENLRIDHKAVVTAYNRDSRLWELMEDILEEHDVFTALLQLNELVKKAEALTEADYGASPDWQRLQNEIAAANALLRSEEPTAEALKAAYESLKDAYLSVADMSELTGKVLIELTPDANGTYTLTARVADASRTVYRYKWSSGETTASISGVPANELISRTVTVTAEGMLGQLKGQLSVPEAPSLTVASTGTTLTVSWQAPAAADNRPLPTAYALTLYKDGAAVQALMLDGTALSGTFTGLAAGESYTVELIAVSPVGRSDTAKAAASTTSSSEATPVTPGKPENPAKPSEPTTPSDPDAPGIPEPTPAPSSPDEAKPEPIPPQTGKAAAIFLPALLFVSAALVLRKKKKD